MGKVILVISKQKHSVDCEMTAFPFIHSVSAWSPRHLLVLVVWCIWWIGGSYWPDGIVLVCLFGRKWAAVSLYKYEPTKQGNSTSQEWQTTWVTGLIYSWVITKEKLLHDVVYCKTNVPQMCYCTFEVHLFYNKPWKSISVVYCKTDAARMFMESCLLE